MRFYGFGFNKTQKEDATRCVVEVHSPHQTFWYQCNRPRGKGTGKYRGLLCGSHAGAQKRGTLSDYRIPRPKA